MANYQTIPYGAGYLYGSNGGADAPQDLRFYRTNVDNVYVFHWGFDPVFISPTLTSIDFELQLAKDPDFTIDVSTFLSADVITYQNGDVRKGYAINVAPRLDGLEQTWYARVRSKMGVGFSDWSNTLVFNVLERFELEETERVVLNLPDDHVYGKEDLKKPVGTRNTNLYVIAQMYGLEFDRAKLENILTAKNLLIELCRDENLYDNFGYLFDYIRPPTQEFVEYRETLRNLLLAALSGSTVDAILRVVRSFTGVNPILNLVRERRDLYLSTILETPPEIPNNIITYFSTSSAYVPRSIVVYKNGLVQYADFDYTENHVTPGIDMGTPPNTGDLIEVVFDIGVPDDPIPLCLDLDNGTSLTGSLNFTHNSEGVTGTGTSFLSELAPNTLVRDSLGNIGEVASITSNASLTLKGKWLGPTQTGAASKVNFNSAKALTGAITLSNGSPIVTGINSRFVTELYVGATITDRLGSVLGKVQTITSNSSLTLTSPWTGSSQTTIDLRKVTYDDMTLWSSGSMAYGLVILVKNPGQFTLERDLLELLVKKILPAHILVYFEYE